MNKDQIKQKLDDIDKEKKKQRDEELKQARVLQELAKEAREFKTFIKDARYKNFRKRLEATKKSLKAQDDALRVDDPYFNRKAWAIKGASKLLDSILNLPEKIFKLSGYDPFA